MYIFVAHCTTQGADAVTVRRRDIRAAFLKQSSLIPGLRLATTRSSGFSESNPTPWHDRGSVEVRLTWGSPLSLAESDSRSRTRGVGGAPARSGYQVRRRLGSVAVAGAILIRNAIDPRSARCVSASAGSAPGRRARLRVGTSGTGGGGGIRTTAADCRGLCSGSAQCGLCSGSAGSAPGRHSAGSAPGRRALLRVGTSGSGGGGGIRTTAAPVTAWTRTFRLGSVRLGAPSLPADCRLSEPLRHSLPLPSPGPDHGPRPPSRPIEVTEPAPSPGGAPSARCGGRDASEPEPEWGCSGDRPRRRDRHRDSRTPP
jgi:hypothetical protein